MPTSTREDKRPTPTPPHGTFRYVALEVIGPALIASGCSSSDGSSSTATTDAAGTATAGTQTNGHAADVASRYEAVANPETVLVSARGGPSPVLVGHGFALLTDSSDLLAPQNYVAVGTRSSWCGSRSPTTCERRGPREERSASLAPKSSRCPSSRRASAPAPPKAIADLAVRADRYA